MTGLGPAEATATIVHRVLAELGLADQVLLWNVVPTHPGTDRSNRPPTRAEVAAGLGFAEELAHGRCVIAVGRIAAGALGAPYIRHPIPWRRSRVRVVAPCCNRRVTSTIRRNALSASLSGLVFQSGMIQLAVASNT